MTSEVVTKTIDLIIAPVVMITACALIVNGLLTRYASVGDRLRLVNQERLNLLELDLSQNRFKADRLHELDHILSDLFRHHHLVHNVLVIVYLAILIFMLDMLVIALAISTHISWLSQFVVIVFLIGIGILFWGIVLIALELATSHHSIQFEVHRTCQLCRKSSSNPKKRKN